MREEDLVKEVHLWDQLFVFYFFILNIATYTKLSSNCLFLIKYTCMDQKYSNVTLLQLYWKTSQKVFEISWSLWYSLCFKKNTQSLTVFCPHEEFGLMKLNCSCSLQKSMGSVIKYLVVLEVIIVSLNSSFEDHKKWQMKFSMSPAQSVHLNLGRCCCFNWSWDIMQHKVIVVYVWQIMHFNRLLGLSVIRYILRFCMYVSQQVLS